MSGEHEYNLVIGFCRRGYFAQRAFDFCFRGILAGNQRHIFRPFLQHQGEGLCVLGALAKLTQTRAIVSADCRAESISACLKAGST